jgi:hypothetical protein
MGGIRNLWNRLRPATRVTVPTSVDLLAVFDEQVFGPSEMVKATATRDPAYTERLVNHLRTEIERGHVVVWQPGFCSNAVYVVETTFRPVAAGGIRRVDGLLACPSGRLTYAGWTDVLARIYGDKLMASPTRRVGAGTYRYTLVQHAHPSTYDDLAPGALPGFVLGLQPTTESARNTIEEPPDRMPAHWITEPLC